MIRHLTLIILAVLLCVPSFAQNGKYVGNYDVLLKSGTERFEANLDEFLKNPNITSSETVDGYFYRFLQFKSIPDLYTLQRIKDAGVILFDYVPHKTYIAGIPTSLNFSKMKKWGVRSIEKMNSLQKMSKSILGPVYPEWAERGSDIQVVVSYFRNISATTAQTLLSNANIRVIELQPNSQTAIVQIAKAEIDYLANLDFLYYVEAIPEPPMPEDRLGRTLHRSNVINTMIPSGKHYDGSGVHILTRDDGAINHIDFKNRVSQPTASNSAGGTHGDGVAGIMGGAGNLDPTIQGMAPASFMHVIDYVANFANDNTLQLHQNDNVMVTNSSYSNGCNDGYTTTARVVDQQTYQYPSLLHVFSAGNSNNNDCGYGAGTQWGNITGGHKIGKNVIATANLYPDGSLVASSSRGPSADGRLKPDISANGQDQLSISEANTYQSFGGTSGAAPGIAGVAAQLYGAYRQLNNGQDPESALIKAVLMNGAEDYGNPGPDYKYGFGRVNAYRSLEILENGNYVSGTITQSSINTHTINVPANVKQVKVMTYWAEDAAAINSSMVLINDLDMTMTTPNGEVILPWVLDNTPNPTTLDANAVRGVDNLNNVEQVTLDEPAAGSYIVNVTAPVVPSGSVNYYVVTTFIYDEITVVYPIGGEGLIPGTVERIHWDAYGNQSSFLIQMTNDGGANWYTVANVSGDERMFDWTIPNLITGAAQIRIIRDNNTGQSQANFSILGRPEGLTLTQVCPSSIRIEWDSLAGATAYDVFVLGYQYMDSIGTTTDTYFDIPVTNPIGTHWVAVRGAGANGLRGRRTIAEELNITQLQGCLFNNDVALTNIATPNGYMTACSASNFDVTIEIYNNSASPKSNFPVSYDFNGNVVTETYADTIASMSSVSYTFSQGLGTLGIGNYNLTAWTSLTNEDFYGNDTSTAVFEIATGSIDTIPFSETFDAMAACGVTTNCGATVCPLGNGWQNLTNGVQDDIDWRVDANGTTSTGTGPAADHTSGTGNYIYLEASNGCDFQEAVLMSPCIDLTNAVTPQLSFWYHMNGTNVGELYVDIYDGSQWINEVIALSGAQGNSWNQGFVNLQPYAGNIVNARFRGITGGGWSSDIALDDIQIAEVTLAPVAAFTTDNAVTCVGSEVNLIDASSNIPSAWTWSISPATFNFVNGTTANSQNPTVVFNAVGTYDIQLTASNPNGLDSVIQTGVIFINNGNTIPLVEDFEGGAFPPAVLSILNPDNSDTWQQGNATGADGNPTQAAYVDNFAYNAAGEEDKLVFTLDLTNDTAATLSFDVAYARYSAGYSDGLRIDVFTNCGSNFGATVFDKDGTDLATVPDQTTSFTPAAAAHWRNEVVNLSDYVGSVVKVEIINECGYGNSLYIDNINLNNIAVNTGGSAPFAADFTPSVGNFCVGQSVSVFNNSTGNIVTYDWNFGIDATPQTATGEGPHSFTYASNGQKTVKLLVTDANGNMDSLSANVFIQGIPTASFQMIQLNDSTIKLFNGATFANSIVWDFGDGNTSTVQNPQYTYDSTSTFTVTLTVNGDCGMATFSQDVTTQLVNADNRIQVAEQIAVFPNPNDGRFTLQITGATKDLTLKIVDVQGRVLREWQEQNPTVNYSKALNIEDLAAGVYFIQVQTDTSTDVVRILKE